VGQQDWCCHVDVFTGSLCSRIASGDRGYRSLQAGGLEATRRPQSLDPERRMGILSRPTNTKIGGPQTNAPAVALARYDGFLLTLIASNVVLPIVSFVLAGLVLV
jgi:hypothetical protein